MKGNAPENLEGPNAIPLCRCDGSLPSEIMVLADSKASITAHRELFRFSEGVYMLFDGKEVIDELNRIQNGRIRSLHVSGGWGWLLSLALWKQDMRWGDIMLLLGNAGMEREELMPFRNGPPEDIFPALYYGKRFDVLRRLCRRARKNLEEKPLMTPVRADFHLVEPDLSQIVASSL